MASRKRLPRTVELDVVGQAADGLGSGVAAGRKCIVKGALPGEKVSARVYNRVRREQVERLEATMAQMQE